MESQPWGIHGEIIDTCNCVHSISGAPDYIISVCGRGAARTLMRLHGSQRKSERRSSILPKRHLNLLPDIILCCSRIPMASALR